MTLVPTEEIIGGGGDISMAIHRAAIMSATIRNGTIARMTVHVGLMREGLGVFMESASIEQGTPLQAVLAGNLAPDGTTVRLATLTPFSIVAPAITMAPQPTAQSEPIAISSK
jgi:hypothetical protein